MKAFNFPLESLRTLRKQREQAAQQRYARTLVFCDGVARLLQLAEEELKAGHALLMGELENEATADRIIKLRTWRAGLEVRGNECAAAYDEGRRDANDGFRLMTAAAREREALDRFHGKSL